MLRGLEPMVSLTEGLECHTICFSVSNLDDFYTKNGRDSSFLISFSRVPLHGAIPSHIPSPSPSPHVCKDLIG